MGPGNRWTMRPGICDGQYLAECMEKSLHCGGITGPLNMNRTAPGHRSPLCTTGPLLLIGQGIPTGEMGNGEEK
jgi:hypothetical protein